MAHTRTELEQAVEIAREIRQRERFNKIDFYDPYPYQKMFHDTGSQANQRLLMAANRIGKSYCGSAELSYHLTGLYPKWWGGRRFRQPIVAWAGGVSNETTTIKPETREPGRASPTRRPSPQPADGRMVVPPHPRQPRVRRGRRAALRALARAGTGDLSLALSVHQFTRKATFA